MFGWKIVKKEDVEDQEREIDSLDMNIFLLQQENFGLRMKNKELTTMLEKTRCRYVIPNDGKDYELEILRKQIGFLKTKYHGAMGLVKSQRDYYTDLIAQLTLEDMI